MRKVISSLIAASSMTIMAIGTGAAINREHFDSSDYLLIGVALVLLSKIFMKDENGKDNTIAPEVHKP